MRYRIFIVRIMAKGRVPPKNVKVWSLTNEGGGEVTGTKPLLQKYWPAPRLSTDHSG